MTHRRAEIINALETLFETLKDPIDESGFPVQIKTIQKRFLQWTTLDKQNAIPALLLNYGRLIPKRYGGGDAEYAGVGETEEPLPISLVAVMKETDSSDAITDQVSDMLYSIEKLINGTSDLDVEGVVNTEIDGVETAEGRYAPYEAIKFRIMVTHIYRATISV